MSPDDGGDGVASPCLDICRMSEVTGLCVGCFRTLDEIVGWGSAGEHERLAILAAVEKRRQQLDPWGEQLRGDCAR
jgi:predicted Fe-S protein YdhL (DUF1289 family)